MRYTYPMKKHLPVAATILLWASPLLAFAATSQKLF